MEMANSLGLVFEGPDHPYKQNLMKVEGRTRIADSQTMEEAVRLNQNPV